MFIDARMPAWMNVLGPILQALLAICVTLLLIALIFNFEEIFGQTPADAEVELDEDNSESEEEQETEETKSAEEKVESVAPKPETRIN